ncbi:Sulfatase modifying factor 1 precursor (C-alpha-formyglycine- generating enzyme 1) [Labilithrix luteola]|uniref:Sulfatase modifying factor 1 (C-alpha-formyglycine-generating enzyme 1) n=1 Tax=Labilithrix luteola TaxID=1391654 RepID=A0A0K1QB49_9BACT|nr:formylglycine-generating enzyme family protein [Labilithrix luteola]AKV02892.1 Sulfatase modifying factor 1 precursor (C-alpha-formyglycine- generating enzyme 1) [Labilithrix luteola]
MRVLRTLIFLGAVGAACDETLPPRGQVLVYLDTDATVSSSDGTPGLFDRVLVEVFEPGATAPCSECSRELALDAEKLRTKTFSFGFLPPPRVLGYRIRLRMFRSVGLGTPRAASTVELVGYLPAVGEDGIVSITASFRTGDVGKPQGTLASPIVFTDGPPNASAVGTWPGAREVPCRGEVPGGAVCVPGGAFFMGDPRVSIASDLMGGASEHLVVLSPYFLGDHEVTVAEVRSSGVASVDSRGRSTDPTDDSADPLGRCDYTSVAGAWDDRPLDCVSWQLASKYCQSLGGDLPTEAQLERVASHAGSTLWPWGDDAASCVDIVAPDGGGCREDASLDVETRTLPSVAGAVPRDVVLSSDGRIADLGANLSEWTADAFERDDGTCWKEALLRDPSCKAATEVRSIKGGNLLQRVVDAAQVRRAATAKDASFGYPTVGFRCAWPAR